MVLKSIRPISFFIFITILCAAVLPSGNAYALIESSNTSASPSLEVFIQQVRNGQANELRGIYIHGVLAAGVVQQPNGKDEFISPWENFVTQFTLPSRFGSTGLIAHNYLAGKTFTLLQEGQEINLVYGDGHTSKFAVSEIRQYQALDSFSTASSFFDLKNQRTRTSSELFTEIYKKPGMLILQTCIEANQNTSWGRLFVIAQPVSE